MKKFLISGILAGSALGLAALISTPASAENYGETHVSMAGANVQRVKVDYSDLDLTKSAGIETLQGRISRAARRVCGPSDWRQAGSLRIASANKACYENAVAEGMNQIHGARTAAVAK